LYRSQYRPCAAAQQTGCQLTPSPISDVTSAQPTAHAPSTPPPPPPRDVTAESAAAAAAFATSFFVRSRLDEIIERELRHLNAREEAELAKPNPSTTSISSTESDEGFFDKMPRHEIEAGGE
jgi:hypothetical protein